MSLKHLNRPVLFFLFTGLALLTHTQNALAKPAAFTVFLNGIANTQTGSVRPCYPVIARFEHPAPSVTRVRMRYPYDHRMFMIFPVNQDIPMTLHENFMRTGELSLSDFIAEDEQGNTFGQITLTFIPLDPKNMADCNTFPDS